MIKIGKLLNSLQYKVDKNIEESLYQNKTFLSSKWSLLEYNILRWSQRPSTYIILTVALAALTILNFLIWEPELTPLITEYAPKWQRLIDWQGTFLAGQLTIVGVVYPLVIGLIGVLFQNKSAKKTLFPIYQMYSGFMFAGLSGLFLSIFIIVGYFLSASLDDATYLIICITSAIWLTFNVLLTSWFFSTTFMMLDETKRDRLVVRFTIHELCETDIRNRIRELLLQNAVQNKLLVSPDENVIKVKTYKYSDSRVSSVIIPSKKQIYVNDVYFVLINSIIHFNYWKLRTRNWLKRNETLKKVVTLKGFRWLNINHTTEPEIVVQPLRNVDSGEDLTIVRYSGFHMGWFSKLLIKASIKTKRMDGINDKSLTSMMVGFIGSANDAIREKNISEFKSALRNIEKWHSEIASALSFINDNKEEDNWLLLPSAKFFSGSFLEEILSEYYRLARAAVEIIPENIEFFDEIIYIHKRIFSRRKNLVKSEGYSLIQGSYLTWSLLMEWRSYSSTSKDMRIVTKYEDVLFDFVGSWESWLDYIEPRRNRLDNLHRALPLFIAHLEFTAHTAISALRFNNIEAAGWGIDMLNNWIFKLSSSAGNNGLELYRWKSELVTHDLIFKEDCEQTWNSILNGHEFKLAEAFNIAMANAAFDVRIITACYVLLKPNLDNNDKIKQYVKALLAGTAIHPTGTARRRISIISSPSDILGAYIRHRDYPNYGDGTYGSWLSKVLGSFGRVNEKRRISGRIYSGWGSNDPLSMNKAYVEIAISLSNNQWQLERKWYEIIFSDLFRHQDQDSLVTDLENWLKLSEEIQEPFLSTSEEFGNNLVNFKGSIQEIIEKIKQRQFQIVAESEVDEALLKRFGVICSKPITDDEKGPTFPISLFREINYDGTRKNEDLHQIKVQQYLKKDIAQNIDSSRAVNEDDWLQQTTRSFIKSNILSKLLSYKPTDEKRYKSVDNKILDIYQLCKEINEPVLITGSTELLHLLDESSYNHDLANKFDIHFIDGYGENYVCHLRDIIVFRVNFSNVNFSLLTTLQIFESITFGLIEDQQFVEVSYIPSNENENIGELCITYWMNVTFKEEIPCIKMEVLEKPDVPDVGSEELKAGN